MTRLSVVVDGTPIPQGSVRAISRNGRGQVIQGSSTAARKRLDEWRNAVTAALAEAHAGRPPLDGPLSVGLYFYLPMPKSRPAADRRNGYAWSSVRPDLDKLIRAVLDAATAAKVWHDDAQVAEITAGKTETDVAPQCRIEINRAF